MPVPIFYCAARIKLVELLYQNIDAVLLIFP
jgi:hypothetical protein